MSKKILLVEDEALIALSESQILQKHGFAVDTVHSGERAIERVEADLDIALILMDIDLGRGIDGTAAAQRILAGHDLPIVFLSSHTEPQVVEKTEGITSYGYIVKNSGETVLLASIRMAFRLYEAHLELKRQKEHLRTALVQQEQTEEKLIEKSAEMDRFFSNSLDMLCIAHIDGTLIRLNPEWERVLGYSLDELEGRSVFDFMCEEDKERVKDVGNFEARFCCRDGTYCWIELRSQVQDSTLYGAARDISARKQAELQLKASEESLRITLDSIGDAVISTDVSGRVTRMNPVAERLCGWQLESARGRSLDEVFYIVNADTRRRVHNPVAKALQSGEVVGLANHTMLISQDGTEYQIADSAAPIRDADGVINGVVLVFRDVTEEYKQRQELLRTRDELSGMLQVLPEGFVRVDAAGRINYANETAEWILGLTESAISGHYYSDRKFHQIDTAGDPLPGEELPLAVTLREKRGVHGFVHGIVAPDGETRWLSVNTAPLAEGAIASFRDITEQRENADKLAGSEKKYRDLAESVGAVLWEYDILRDRWTYVAPQVQDLLGYEPGEWFDVKFWADRIHPEDRTWATEYCAECTQQGRNHQFEYRFRKKNGDFVWLRDDVKVETAQGKPIKLRGFMVDISNRKQAEIDLQQALDEKQLLMQELNHRIKNNLSMVSSLIGLKDAESETDLSDIMHQIDAVGIIHEKLYQSENIRSIALQGYLQELLERVFRSFASRPVDLQIRTGDIQVSTNLAVIIGLIANEIATNAIKYGFRDGEKAVFRVEMSAEPAANRYELILSNIGRPFPKDKDLQNPGTLGLQLISTLVDQLDGTIELQKRPHPVFTIRFPM